LEFAPLCGPHAAAILTNADVSAVTMSNLAKAILDVLE
jgi:hypothetical protein